jgi:hypothetical protein
VWKLPSGNDRAASCYPRGRHCVSTDNNTPH